MTRLPAFNPLAYPDAVCSQCGMVMEREIERGPMNRVSKVIYRCVNEESGCSYQVESDIRLTGMAAAIVDKNAVATR